MISMKLLFMRRKKQNSKETLEELKEKVKKPHYTLDSVFPTKEIYEIAMGIKTEENSEK